MAEHLLIALWAAPGVDTSALADKWGPLALHDRNVESLTMSFAEADQGIYAGGDPIDVLIHLGLEKAHDLDDVPERGELYRAAREVNVWRVDRRFPKSWDRTWADGEY